MTNSQLRVSWQSRPYTLRCRAIKYNYYTANSSFKSATTHTKIITPANLSYSYSVQGATLSYGASAGYVFDYYVSPTGDDTLGQNGTGVNVGTLTNPASLSFVATVATGKKVGMLPGTYQYMSTGGVATSFNDYINTTPTLGGLAPANNVIAIPAGVTLATCDSSGNYSPRTAIVDPANPTVPIMTCFRQGCMLVLTDNSVLDGVVTQNTGSSAVSASAPGCQVLNCDLRNAVITSELYNGNVLAIDGASSGKTASAYIYNTYIHHARTLFPPNMTVTFDTLNTDGGCPGATIVTNGWTATPNQPNNIWPYDLGGAVFSGGGTAGAPFVLYSSTNQVIGQLGAGVGQVSCYITNPLHPTSGSGYGGNHIYFPNGTFNGYISGTTVTIVSGMSSTGICTGVTIFGPGVTPGVVTGQVSGGWTINAPSQTVGSAGSPVALRFSIVLTGGPTNQVSPIISSQGYQGLWSLYIQVPAGALMEGCTVMDTGLIGNKTTGGFWATKRCYFESGTFAYQGAVNPPDPPNRPTRFTDAWGYGAQAAGTTTTHDHDIFVCALKLFVVTGNTSLQASHGTMVLNNCTFYTKAPTANYWYTELRTAIGDSNSNITVSNTLFGGGGYVSIFPLTAGVYGTLTFTNNVYNTNCWWEWGTSGNPESPTNPAMNFSQWKTQFNIDLNSTATATLGNIFVNPPSEGLVSSFTPTSVATQNGVICGAIDGTVGKNGVACGVNYWYITPYQPQNFPLLGTYLITPVSGANNYDSTFASYLASCMGISILSPFPGSMSGSGYASTDAFITAVQAVDVNNWRPFVYSINDPLISGTPPAQFSFTDYLNFNSTNNTGQYALGTSGTTITDPAYGGAQLINSTTASPVVNGIMTESNAAAGVISMCYNGSGAFRGRTASAADKATQLFGAYRDNTYLRQYSSSSSAPDTTMGDWNRDGVINTLDDVNGNAYIDAYQTGVAAFFQYVRANWPGNTGQFQFQAIGNLATWYNNASAAPFYGGGSRLTGLLGQLDGGVMEHAIGLSSSPETYMSAANWRASIQNIIQGMRGETLAFPNGALSILLSHDGVVNGGASSGSDGIDTVAFRAQRFGLGVACLYGIGYAPNATQYTWAASNRYTACGGSAGNHGFFEEWDCAGARGIGWLGVPTSAIPTTANGSNGIFYRVYTNGVVLVNFKGSSTSASTSLPFDTWAIRGTQPYNNATHYVAGTSIAFTGARDAIFLSLTAT